MPSEAGRQYRQGVDWSSGHWRFSDDFSDCNGSLSTDGLLATATAMVTLARSHPLPSAPGLVPVWNACGDPTSYISSVTWLDGKDRYSTSALDSYSVPMLLAASMLAWRSSHASSG